MTTINIPTAARQIRATRPVAVLLGVAAALLLVATAAMVLKGHLPTQSLVHGLDRIPAPVRDLFLGSDGSRLVEHAAARQSG
jgi:hypothetical protein